MSDNWQPRASLEVLRLRARMLTRLRAFFDARRVLEVETPALSQAATTEVHLQSYRTCDPGLHRDALYLHTSPEMAMKRLLAAGSGDIYQVCKVFRAGEAGARHNPEFTLVEWYRRGLALDELIDETIELIEVLLAEDFRIARVAHLAYAELFQRYLQIDPAAASSVDLARIFTRNTGQTINLEQDAASKDAWLDLLLTHLIEPQLPADQLTVVRDYPASQASLARLKEDDSCFAQRFEVYIGSLELANGFNELAEAGEQRQRMQRDMDERQRRGLDAVPLDTRFLQALEAGLPACCGVALGFDRVVMLAAGVDDIRDVLAFPGERA